MAINEFLALQKAPLLNLKNQETFHYLNPFGELLFVQEWKWNQLHHHHAKSKLYQPQSTPSLKKDILLWFENLSDKEKIAVTAINNPPFSDSFIKLLQQRANNRLFNLSSERWVNGIGVGSQDPFFDQLLEKMRIGYLSEPILYFGSAEIMNIRMLNWLNSVSNSRVFQYASKTKKGEENPLWFSSLSYRYLQDWLASQLEIVIVTHFLNKTIPEFIIPDLQFHLKAIGKQIESSGLSLTLHQVWKKSKAEISLLKQKIKDQEQKFMEVQQQKLIKNMQIADQKKKNKKRPKRKSNKKEQVNVVVEESKEAQIKINQIKKAEPIAQEMNAVQLMKQQKVEIKELNIIEKQEFKQNDKKESQIILEEVEQPDIRLSLQQEKKQQLFERKPSAPKNLIRISPKRTRSPEEVRSKDMFSQFSIRQKYSEQDKGSPTVVEDEKSSEATNFYQEFGLQQRHTVKRKRKRGKKQNQKHNEIKQILYSRLVSRQIEHLVDELGYETNSLYNLKIIAFERVRIFVQSLYPMTNAILFGSNAVGLSLPNSDVDILLTCLNCFNRQAANEILAQIAVEINAMGWVVSCSTYLWAKVPIVKLQIDTSIPFLHTKRKQDLFKVYNSGLISHLDQSQETVRGSIKVDITINIEGTTCVGYQSTILMRDWISKTPAMQKIIVLFKYILSVRDYNSNFNGGIGSYCLFVMIAAYLKEFGAQSEPNLCKYFQNILKWYGQDFDNTCNVVLLREQGSCFMNELYFKQQLDEGKRGLLKLVDPITGRLMSSSCIEYNNIKMQFRRILIELKTWSGQIEEELKINQINSPELLRIAQNKKSVDKWLNKFQHKYQPSLKGVIDRNFS